MGYMALYRKWRPLVFDDVIGQAHITATLKNEIKAGKIAHAYLFTGTRGTGKTSTAKIMSRAVNCKAPVNGNPCNECEICKAELNETVLDVIEIDAASNTGVDNIRSIIEQVQYKPTVGRYKVYIIDEVHMLSQGAFNALLKTLEEPPAHVIFILATTEIHKVPATILSRCQRFDFKTISVEEIAQRIKEILAKEGLLADDEAIHYIAYLGDGSMRDALSILDQCLAFGHDGLTYQNVADIVGAFDDQALFLIAEAICNRDTKETIRLFEDMADNGKNMDSFASGMLDVFRQLMLAKISDGMLKQSYSDERNERINRVASSFSKEALLSCIEVLNELLNNLKFHTMPRVLIETALIRMTQPTLDDSPAAMLARIRALEDQLNGVQIVTTPPTPASGSAPESKKAQVKMDAPPKKVDTKPPQTPLTDEISPLKPQQTVSSPSSAEEDLHKISDHWSEVTDALFKMQKLTLCSDLMGTKVCAEDGGLTLYVTDAGKKERLSKKETLKEIENCVRSRFGSDVQIRVETAAKAEETQAGSVFESLKNFSKDFPENFKLE